MIISISNNITLPDAPDDLKETLKKTLTIENPMWIENNKRGRWNKNTPKELEFYQEKKDGSIVMPRGFIRQLINLCHFMNTSFTLEDTRLSLPNVPITFHGKLKDFQKESVDAMLEKEFGTLNAPTGAGKTVMALYMIAQRKQPALIVVHTKDLAQQWIDRAETFLKIPAEEIGMIGAGQDRIGEKLTIAMVQSLYKRGRKTAPHIGYLIVDECHRTPSRTFHEAVTAFDSRYMTGLSATPFRRDKLSKLIFWYLGDLIHEVDKKHLVRSGDILETEVIFRETEFDSKLDASMYYSKVIAELVNDRDRNKLITDDVANEVKKGSGVCLILSDRKAHCDALKAFLYYNHRIDSEVLTGDLKVKQRKEILEKLEEGKVKVLIATGQLIGEGFDSRHLSSLFLATPIKFSGRLLQYLGRIMRPAPGKNKAVVYDYVDVNIGVLEAGARTRVSVYNMK